jgi:hypothetical protein
MVGMKEDRREIRRKFFDGTRRTVRPWPKRRWSGLPAFLISKMKYAAGRRTNAPLCARPVLDDLAAWLPAQLARISSKAPLTAAIRYAVTRIKRLRAYLDHGFLEIDNSELLPVRWARS